VDTKNEYDKVSNQERIQKRMDVLIGDALPYYKSTFNNMVKTNFSNAETLLDFITFEYNTQNVKQNTKLTHIKIICFFNKYLEYKDFEKITKNDILEYLNSLRKPEFIDPTHKSIGTYNVRQMVLSKFFRWFYNVHLNKNNDGAYIESKNWITPSCMLGIRQLPRKEKSPFKPSDIWTEEDNALFLKYCPEIRDRCYHAMACDTSARPHELLSLRISDIVFKLATTGIQYAEVHVKESKTRPRTVPLIFSIPYVKDWINSHPQASNPSAFLFISLADINFGEKLSENGLYKTYTRTYKKHFQKLVIDESTVPEADKSFIRNLLTKPWTPYILRHSSLTSKSLILKESALRSHAGWTTSSKMTDVYIHYFGNESTKSLLEAYGIEKNIAINKGILKTKTCPNCSEPNKPDSRFCSSCKMVLEYSSYQETLEEQKKKEDRISNLELDMQAMKQGQQEILMLLRDPEKFLSILQSKT